jgi:hypothetical protein
MYAGIGTQIGQYLVEVSGVELHRRALGLKIEPEAIRWYQAGLAVIVDKCW